MNQCLFDEIVLIVLETISSETYLNELGIYRPKPVRNWESFKKKVKKQTIEPGIYARAIGDSAHYYGVRFDPKTNTTVVGNGYETIGGLDKKYAIGLDVQENNSHGLCQTFALMFYNFDENKLKPGKEHYFQNAITGFQYLLEFIENDLSARERCWSIKSLLSPEGMTIMCQNHTKERENNFKSIPKKYGNQICLTTLLSIILHPKYADNLKKWFGISKY